MLINSPVTSKTKSYKHRWIFLALVVVFIVLVLGYFYFYSQLSKLKYDNIITVSEKYEVLTYTDELNLFSFKYPTDWNILEKDTFFVNFDLNNDKDEFLVIFPQSNREYDPRPDELSIGGVPKRISVPDNADFFGGTVMYLVPVADLDLHMLILSNTRDAKKLEQIEVSLGTFKFEKEKIKKFQEKEEDDLNNPLGGDVGGLRYLAELYYESNNSSYSGLCNSTGNSFADLFMQLKTETKNKVKCTDSVTTYAVSALYPDGKYYCSDNTGSFDRVSSFHEGGNCP
jgi:hypothetical protein